MAPCCTAVSVAVYHQIDRVLIGRYLSADQLGYYATADNLATMMSILPLAFMSSVYPLLCQNPENDGSFRRLSDTSFRWLLSSSIGVAGLLSLIGPALIILFYGQEFAFSGQILRILVWDQVAVCFGIIITQILLARHLQRFLTISTIIGAIVNIVGNLIVIPKFGVIGSAWVTVISYTVAGVLLYAIFPSTKIYGRQGLAVLMKILAPAIVLLGIIFIILEIYHKDQRLVRFDGIRILHFIHYQYYGFWG